MAAGQHTLLQRLRRASLPRDGGGMTDGKLLESYLDRRDEAAFEALVRRHGPMVLGVCRRLLRSHHDAEDAFQATFLVLVRRAASVVPREKVGNWLYGVAYRTALEARTRAARRRAREGEVGAMSDRQFPRDDAWAELRALLDKELSQLPENYRAAVVLCELEGKTVREAAGQLGLPQGTLASQLSRGRALLAKRLSRRGLAPGAGALAAALPVVAAPVSVPAPLMISTLEAAAVAGLVSPWAAELTERVVRVMLLNELKTVMAVLLLVVALAAGALAYATGGTEPAGGGRQSNSIPRAQNAGASARQSWKSVATIGWYVPGGVAFIGDGKTLASGGTGEQTTQVTLWDLAGKKEKVSFVSERQTVGLYCLAVSPGGKLLAWGDAQGTVSLWDVAAGKELAALQRHQGAVRCVAFSADGKTMASGGEDRTVRLWDVAEKKERAALEGHEGSVNAAAFSPDGKTLATEGSDNMIKLWDVAEGKARATLKGHTARVTAAAYSRDGKTLATGGADGTVRLWDPEGGKERTRLKGQTGRADAVAFTPDGKSVAATGYEKGKDKQITGIVRIWDAATGEERAVLRADMGIPTALAFSPDGKRLAVGGFTSRADPVVSNNGTLEVWQLER
jgi:RNA polymerase sigma factor (sigma-70 family)